MTGRASRTSSPITGPGSPSVLSNMVVSIEQHVDWVADCLQRPARSEGLDVIEPTPTAEEGWVQHVNDCADITLFPHGELLVHGRQRARQAAGVPALRRRRRRLPQGLRRGREPRLSRLRPRRPGRRALQRRRDPPPAARRRDPARAHGRARACPPLETLSVDEARGVRRARWPRRGRPGPRSARSSTARFPAPAGDLAYRLYRPATPGPHPIVVYFHGGGWVLGSHDVGRSVLPRPVRAVRRDRSCRSTTATHPRPASRPPSTTRFAALQWVAANAAALGGAARAGWPCAAGAPAATSPRSCASWPATPAARRSPARCC